MTFFDLHTVFSSEENALTFLKTQNFFQETRCYKCKSIMKLYLFNKIFRCPKKSCRTSRSVFNKTFFSKTKLPINTVLWITYMYLHKMPVSGIIATSGVQSEAVSNWTHYIRQLCADSVREEEVIIGGPGIIIEIDETKLGKRKYHRGHRVDGVWVIAGIERTANKKVFLIEVEDRTIETITNVLKTYVRPESIVYSDGWAAYKAACEACGLEHHVVNHKYYFKDPVSGVHTNTVEGLNNGIKHLIKPRHRTRKGINDQLYYFIWRRQNKGDVWNAFISDIKETIYLS